MEKKELKGLNLNVYEETLENGLKIFICPMKKQKIYASMTVNFGAGILEFEKDGKMIKLPEGTAHFLEHKMFIKKGNFDISRIFEKNGAYSNAYTNMDATVYHFNSPTCFYDNLLALLRCVNEPYFTDEGVEGEKNIILQELKARLSNNFNLAYFKTNYNSYHHLPHKYPVLGTEESIKRITKEDLYNAYNSFYIPSNMHLIVTGNVNPKEVVDFVSDYYGQKELKSLPVLKKYNEKKSVVKSFEKINKDINNKVCRINYKVDLGQFSISKDILRKYLIVLIISKFSSFSGFEDLVLKEPKIISSVDLMIEYEENFVNIGFCAEVKDETVFINLIEKQLIDLTVDDKKLEIYKKDCIKSCIINTDFVIGTSKLLNSQIISFGNVEYDIIDKIKTLNTKEANEIGKKLDFSNKTIAVVEK